MFGKKIFVLMSFIVSMMIFVIGCGNETAAKSFEAQKIREGINLFNSSDYKGVIGLLDEISALKLNTAGEYNLRGEYLVKIGEYHFDTMNYDKGKELFDLAIRDYDSAIKIAPNDVDSYINRGNFYCKHGKQDLAIELQEYERAIEELNKCIEIYPKLNAVNLRRHCDYLLHKTKAEK